MEERRIGGAREVPERDVALVACATDRVVALVARTELVSLDVGDPAEELRCEQLSRERRIQTQLRSLETQASRRDAAQPLEGSSRADERHPRVSTMCFAR